MSRWLVEVQGDRFDIDELPYWFPDGEIFALSEGEKVFICGPALESLEDASQVYESAKQALEEFFSIIRILQPNVHFPKLGTVFREDENGQRKGTVSASAHLVGRSKARATSTVNPSEHGLKNPTPAQELLAASRRDRGLHLATLAISDCNSSWSRLYLAFEEIETYIANSSGKNVVEAKLCSEGEKKRFTRSANAAEVAGKDARHGFGKGFQAPKNPMSVGEARTFISKLLQATLRIAVENERNQQSAV
jgi:hypothetical protein